MCEECKKLKTKERKIRGRLQVLGKLEEEDKRPCEGKSDRIEGRSAL
jgi:hypothetical protein